MHVKAGITFTPVYFIKHISKLIKVIPVFTFQFKTFPFTRRNGVMCFAGFSTFQHTIKDIHVYTMPEQLSLIIEE